MSLNNQNLKCLDDINNCKCEKCGGDMKCSLVWTHDEYYTSNKYLMVCKSCGKKQWFKDKYIGENNNVWTNAESV